MCLGPILWDGKNTMNFGLKQVSTEFLILPSTSCVTLGKLRSPLPVFYFPHPLNKDINIHVGGLL